MRKPPDFNLDEAIRKIRDFPKPGILFYDITSILMKPPAFRCCIDRMMELYEDGDFSAVAAVESRGFLFAAPFAERKELPLLLLRKKGKLPGRTLSRTFKLEYGEDTIEVHKDDVEPGMKILLVDDLIATGGTLKASAEMLTEAGARVVGIFSVIGLPFLNYADLLSDYQVHTLIEYHSE